MEQRTSAISTYALRTEGDRNLINENLQTSIPFPRGSNCRFRRSYLRELGAGSACLAGGAADQMELSADDLVLAGENVVAE